MRTEGNELVGPLPFAGGPVTPHSHAHGQLHERPCTHSPIHTDTPSHAVTDTHPLFSPGEPGGWDPSRPGAGADAHDGGRPRSSRVSGRAAWGVLLSVTARLLRARGAPQSPRRAARRSLRLFVMLIPLPSWCQLPAQWAPRALASQGVGAGRGGCSAPCAWDPSLAQSGRVESRPMGSLPLVFPSPCLQGRAPRGLQGIHWFIPVAPAARPPGARAWWKVKGSSAAREPCGWKRSSRLPDHTANPPINLEQIRGEEEQAGYRCGVQPPGIPKLKLVQGKHLDHHQMTLIGLWDHNLGSYEKTPNNSYSHSCKDCLHKKKGESPLFYYS